MESTTTVTTTDGQDGENITDIQNYLQSFNKEIGDDANADGQSSGNTTYFTIDASQVISDSNGQTANGGGDGFQTVAIVPSGSGGSYVLIVQNPEGDGTTAEVDGEKLEGKVKEENREKSQDISVYDFDEVHPAAGDGDEIESAEVDGDPDYEEEDGEEEEVKTPKKRASTSKKSTPKKQKVSTPSTPASGSNQHMCNYCNYTSSKRYLLSRHMKSHSEERPHKCGICERGFKTIASLQNHVNTHTGVRPHGCKFCDASFTTSGELVRHVRYRHTHEKPHRCTECDYASVELSKLKRHMRCHTGERPYQCPHCTYASPDTYKLKRHLRIHTGEKPYECDVCHARFTQSNSLKAHRLIHSGNKPVFKCELCPTTCGRKTDLRIHVQKLHTSEKPMTCKRCDQSFPDRYTFKQHLKSHDGEKCFKCDLCNYASISARHLESHMLIHTDQKPFQCDECEQSFRQKQLLKRHKNLYHNPDYVAPQPKEKTHECGNCGKAFRHKGNLMRHMLQHDPDNAAYKEAALQLRESDKRQLIDEEDIDESDEDEDEDDVPSGEDTLDQQTLQFALDPQTQQMLQGEQVVVFEVVQMGEDGESETNVTFEGTQLPKKKKAVRTATLVTQNGTSASGENIIIQLQTEDEEAVHQLEGDAIIDEEGESFQSSPTRVKILSQNSQAAVPPPVVTEDKRLQDQLQKERDKAECFGFKDEDDGDDDAILSMSTVNAK